MNYLLRIFTIFIFAAYFINAQSGSEAYVSQLGDNNFGQIEQVSSDRINRAILTQEGNSNSALINQVRYGFGWNANQASVIQAGNYNSVILEQIGAGNFNGITQAGDRNIIDLRLRGINNFVAILQQGNDNFVSQDLLGYNMNLTVNQFGNNNSLTQVENDPLNSRQIQITQQGNGARLVLVNGQYYR